MLVKEWCESKAIASKIIVTHKEGKRYIRIREVKDLKSLLRDFCDTFDEEYNTMKIYHYLERSFALDTLYEISLDEKVNIGLEQSTEFGKFQYTANFICKRLEKTSNINTISYIADHMEFIDGYWMGDSELNSILLPKFNQSDFTAVSKKLKGIKYELGQLVINNYKGLDKKLVPYNYRGRYFPVTDGFRWPIEIVVYDKEVPHDPELDDFFKLYPGVEVKLDEHRHYTAIVHNSNGYVDLLYHYSKHFNDKQLLLNLFNGFKVGEDITTKLGLFRVTFRHEYLYQHKNKAEAVYTLAKNINWEKLTGKKLFVLNYYVLLMHSEWVVSDHGIELTDDYYFHLGIRFEDLQSMLTSGYWDNTTYYPSGKEENNDYIIKPMYKKLFGVNVLTPYFVGILNEDKKLEGLFEDFRNLDVLSLDNTLQEPTPELSKVELVKYNIEVPKDESYAVKVLLTAYPDQVDFDISGKIPVFVDTYDYESEFGEIEAYAKTLSDDYADLDVNLFDYLKPVSYTKDEQLALLGSVTLAVDKGDGSWSLTMSDNRTFELDYNATRRNYRLGNNTYRDWSDVYAVLACYDELGLVLVNAEVRMIGVIKETLGNQNYDFDYLYTKLKGIVGLRSEVLPAVEAYVDAWVAYDIEELKLALGLIEKNVLEKPTYEFISNAEVKVEEIDIDDLGGIGLTAWD